MRKRVRLERGKVESSLLLEGIGNLGGRLRWWWWFWGVEECHDEQTEASIEFFGDEVEEVFGGADSVST